MATVTKYICDFCGNSYDKPLKKYDYPAHRSKSCFGQLFDVCDRCKEAIVRRVINDDKVVLRPYCSVCCGDGYVVEKEDLGDHLKTNHVSCEVCRL